MIQLNHSKGQAQICLQGAQVIEFTPANQPPVLWLSNNSRFETGKAIRGGIPICWPWFGDHPTDPTLPAHGFARNSAWTVLASQADDHSTNLTLGLEDNESTRALWPFGFKLELNVRLSQALTLTLTTHNSNRTDIQVSEALHSYFAIDDIHHTQISGLEGSRYQDKLRHGMPVNQQGAVRIRAETDRVYLNHESPLTIDDPGNRRRIEIQKQRSRTTVIWNPWQAKSAAMTDMTDDGYARMLCVESANALDNTLQIPPGGTHSLTTRLESIPYKEPNRNSNEAP
ncbi:D-hexose-6-phosphate mutarotase [Motiliproteus coralliicola]|nr:D-hexose-6-phosphate mutarotase [Motiliproteus coralliicola]